MREGASKLEGIGGWLRLVAIGLCVHPMLLLKAIADNVAIFDPDTWRALTTPGVPAYHPLWAPLLLGETGVNLVLFAWSGVLLYVFFAKKRGFPRLVVAYMGVSVAAVLADLALARAIPSAQAHLTASDYLQVWLSAIMGAVLAPIFLPPRGRAATFAHLS